VHGLDALRGVAACMVVLFHLHLLLKVPLPGYLGFVGTTFELGVPLFYMISGFVMYHQYFDAAHGEGFARRFFVKRYARLFPLYGVMLVLVSLSWGIDWAYLPTYLSLTFGFIPGASDGGVPASWSIGVEAVFYLLFIPMVLALRSRMALMIALGIAVGLAFTMQYALETTPHPFWYPATNPVLYAPYFRAGAVVFLQIRFGQRPSLALARLLVVLCPVLLAFASFLEWPQFVGTPLEAGFRLLALPRAFNLFLFLPAFGLLLYVVAMVPPRIAVNRLTEFLGKISYSIYLIHVYLLTTLIKALLPFLSDMASEPLPLFLLAASVTFALLIPISALSHMFVELPGQRLIERMGGVRRR